MKKAGIALILSIFSVTIFAQKSNNPEIPLLGEEAPAFTCASTNGALNFPEDFGTKWKLILSHPKDFTPVCTSELLELAQMQDDFKQLDVEILVVSTDILSQHYDWIAVMEKIEYKNRKPVDIDFPLIDDHKKQISSQYGMLHEYTNTTRDVRGVFVIGPENTIRMIQFYPMEIGRNMEEIKRSIIALQTAEKDDVVLPANWWPGEDALLEYYDDKTLADPEVYQIAWFLTFRRM